MTNHKTLAITSIEAAEEELKRALRHLEELPTFDPSCVLLAAHSLNNYMSVIAGTVDLLTRRLKDAVDDDIYRLIENLGHTNELMRQTVNRLTHASAATDISLVHKKVDLLNLVRLAVGFYQRMASEKQIEIRFEMKTPFQYGWTDAVATAAVLDNLLSNAVKYSPHGKQIRVTASEEGGDFVCAIRDEGPGIKTADLTKLFQQGGKLGHAPTGGEPTNGYGLAVAKELVQKLDGRIWCESQEGQGATFTFRIPISSER